MIERLADAGLPVDRACRVLGVARQNYYLAKRAPTTLDALAYLKTARAVGAPAALEVPRSGLGAHAWLKSRTDVRTTTFGFILGPFTRVVGRSSSP